METSCLRMMIKFMIIMMMTTTTTKTTKTTNKRTLRKIMKRTKICFVKVLLCAPLERLIGLPYVGFYPRECSFNCLNCLAVGEPPAGVPKIRQSHFRGR